MSNQNKFILLKGNKPQNIIIKKTGYERIHDLISDIDELYNEAELREILQEILFISKDYIDNKKTIKNEPSNNRKIVK